MLKMAPALTVSTHSERGAWILKKTTIKLTFPGKCTVSAGTPLTPLPVPYLPLRKALFGTELTRIGLVELPNPFWGFIQRNAPFWGLVEVFFFCLSSPWLLERLSSPGPFGNKIIIFLTKCAGRGKALQEVKRYKRFFFFCLSSPCLFFGGEGIILRLSPEPRVQEASANFKKNIGRKRESHLAS